MCVRLLRPKKRFHDAINGKGYLLVVTLIMSLILRYSHIMNIENFLIDTSVKSISETPRTLEIL